MSFDGQNWTIVPDFVEAYAATPTTLSLDDEFSESMVEICKRISNDFEKLAIALSKIKLTWV